MQGSKDRVYSRIIAILVESCAMVALFGLGFAISNFMILTWTGFQASWIFAIGYVTAVLVIFKVAVGRTWAHHRSSRGGSAPLCFVVVDADTSVPNDSEARVGTPTAPSK
ncbi:hypothetical protein CC2G_014478 [Coprinopsis cinerea AmutBmut pab1-1]|nr:hypothetical protein CC2G_014478 [Coprinopsis cinerea AmutBmut pab1-1]